MRDAEPSVLRDPAREVLASNRRQGWADWAGKAFDFTCPSGLSYPFQWFWDSCLHAIVLSDLDIERAKAELRTLTSMAQADGSIGHVIYWQPDENAAARRRFAVARRGGLSRTVQPPVLAQAVEAVWQRSGDRRFLDEMLPLLWAQHDWLLRERDPDKDGLLSIIQPDESGMDVSPRFDRLMRLPRVTRTGYRMALRRLMRENRAAEARALRPVNINRFLVEDVGFNAIFAEACVSLSRLSQIAGARREAARFERQAAITLRVLCEKCWDLERGLFFDLHGSDEHPERIATVASLLPLILEALPPDLARRLIEEHLLNPAAFWPAFPVPSVALHEPSFLPGRGPLWRGGVWMNTNWWLEKGLRLHGYADAARELAAKSAQLALRSGFREFYGPLNGRGYGAREFSWSTLVLEMGPRRALAS